MRQRQLCSWKALAPHISASSARSPKDGSALLPTSLTQSQIRPFDLSTDESTRMNELKANNNSTRFDPVPVPLKTVVAPCFPSFRSILRRSIRHIFHAFEAAQSTIELANWTTCIDGSLEISRLFLGL
jgi:hypothetical protein